MRGNAIKDAYCIIVRVAWILSFLGALYYLARALFYSDWWLPFFATALLCWVLYCLRPECWAQMQKLDSWLDDRRKRIR